MGIHATDLRPLISAEATTPIGRLATQNIS
jgi:hypothetical protein